MSPRRPLVLILCIAGAVCAQRSPLPSGRLEKVRGVLDPLYRLDFATAEARSRAMISTWPGDPVGYVYLARVYWQQLLVEERALTIHRFTRPDFFTASQRYKVALNPASEQRFRAASADAMERAGGYARAHPGDPAALWLLGVAHQNEASFQLSLNNALIAAVRAGNRSRTAHRALLSLDPKYSDARLVTGVYAYTAGTLPWKLRWLAILLFYVGGTEKGIADLETAAGSGQIAADDARAVLALLYARENRFDLALRKLEQLHQRYPENYLTHLDMAGTRLLSGDAGGAVAAYHDVLSRIEKGPDTYRRLERSIVFNYLGIAYRGLGRFAAAEQWLKRTLAEPGTSARTRTHALLELGKTLDAAGRRGEALARYREVEKLPDEGGTRDEARAHAARPYRER